MALYPYPNEMPAEALGLVLAALQGKPVDTPQALHCAWQVVGFGLSKFVPGALPPRRGTQAAEARAACLGALEEAAADPAKADALPWLTLLPLILDLLSKLLRGVPA